MLEENEGCEGAGLGEMVVSIERGSSEGKPEDADDSFMDYRIYIN